MFLFWLAGNKGRPVSEERPYSQVCAAAGGTPEFPEGDTIGALRMIMLWTPGANIWGLRTARVRWRADVDTHGRGLLHPSPASQQHWLEETLRYAQRRPGALTTKSWYSGANVPGKARVFMVYCGGFKRYHETCLSELESGFPGYDLLPAAEHKASSP